MKDVERRIEEERGIRDRWREKCREKNRRIAELEERVAELELELKASGIRLQESRKDLPRRVDEA
jgi:hypothetical protein